MSALRGKTFNHGEIKFNATLRTHFCQKKVIRLAVEPVDSLFVKLCFEELPSVVADRC